jgi:CTP-dependent riboflavin kinase
VDETRARQLIEGILFRDPERDWSCQELAKLLRLTGRTIAREIRHLREDDKIERSYGKRRRMTFKAKPAISYPRWMDPVRACDLKEITVIRVVIHSIDEDDQ